MTKEQFIKELEHIAESGSNEIRLGNLFEMVAAQSVREDRESRWVSVKDALPEHLDRVLVCYEDSDNVLMASYQDSLGKNGFAIFFADGRKISDQHVVTFWQPVPNHPIKVTKSTH